MKYCSNYLNWLRFPNWKNNSFRRNYMRKYSRWMAVLYDWGKRENKMHKWKCTSFKKFNGISICLRFIIHNQIFYRFVHFKSQHILGQVNKELQHFSLIIVNTTYLLYQASVTYQNSQPSVSKICPLPTLLYLGTYSVFELGC